MTTLEQAAQQALDALEPIHHGNMTPMAENAWKTAITALREALSGVQALSAARAEADSVLEDAALSFTIAHIDYVARYGGRCRDCADESGVCPGSGLPCANPRKAIKHVFDALEYGVKNGFIELPNASRAKPAAALLTETCPGAPNFDGGAAYELAMNIDAARKQAAPKAAPGDEGKALAALRYYMNECSGAEPSISAFHRMVEEALEAAPQQEAQEPVALLVRKNSWRAGQWEAAPPDSPSYGLAWANQRQYVYAAPQPAPAPLSDDAKDAARWRWLSEHIGAAWNEGKFTSLVRIVSDKNRTALNASIDRMMAGDWSYAALAAQGDTP